MGKKYYILLITAALILLSSCRTQYGGSGRMVYMGGRSSIPNHVFSKSTTYVNKRSLRLQRRGFGIAPSGAKFKGTYVKQLKRERRGFRGGITRGRPNALASNRHNQGIGRERRFKFLFPGHPKYYRGNRSKLGLFKMK